MVLVLAVNPLSPAGTAQTFSDNAEYLILVDTNGDADDDIEIELEFEELEDGVQEVEVEMEGDGFEIEGEGVTGSVIDLGGGARLFAGLRDDPFFFDLSILSPPAAGTDTFAGSNVSAIVLEVPTSALTPEGPNIGVWGAIEGSDQIDRVGRPAISTVLIGSGRKDFYNASEPEDDVENFTQDVIDSIVAGFGRTATEAAGLASVLLPDILTLDASLPTTFATLNGRNLDDDVIDIALTILNGAPLGDGIDANDTPFLAAFPYLWPPHGF